MAKRTLSKDWEGIFSKELGGVTVQIEEDAKQGARTYVDNQNGTSIAHIEISSEMKSEMAKIAALRLEHGHLEFDSFNINDPELDGLHESVYNAIEDVRIDLEESKRYKGFRDGWKEVETIASQSKTGKFMWNATQRQAANPDEAYIYQLAEQVNDAEGGRRHENRGPEFYEKYYKFAAAVVRYMGKPPQQNPDDGGDEPDGKKPNPNDSDLKKKENNKLTQAEIDAANAQAGLDTPQTQRLVAQHADIGKPGNGQGLGGLINDTRFTPKSEDAIHKMVIEKFEQIRIKGKKHNEAGLRMNVRVASRARFTGETKLFKVPARQDIRNARFVILQDISSSMGCEDIVINGQNRARYEMAYHFGKAMEEFMIDKGAKVESYRFNDNPFAAGLSLECGGGTNWSAENTKMLLDWVKEGRQVIILTDGGIGFTDEKGVRDLFSKADKRPVGMNFEGDYGGDTGLGAVFPEWKKYTVGTDPRPVIDLIVKEFARRFRWA
jgi:hypothetical protein